MSKGKWRRDDLTGLSKFVLENCDEEFRDTEGKFDVSSYADCNIFNVRSMAAVASFADHRHFKAKVLCGSGSPFHVHEIRLTEHVTGQYLGTAYATHTASLVAGARMHWTRVREARRQRAITSMNCPSPLGRDVGVTAVASVNGPAPLHRSVGVTAVSSG